jgi:hypothetical protein
MARQTKEDRLESHLIAAFGFATLTVTALLGAWFAMLALGAAHDQWPAIPALGYWTTYILLLGIGVVSGTIKGGMKVSTDKD